MEFADMGINTEEVSDGKAKIIATLFDFKKGVDIKTKTDLSISEVKNLTKLKVIAEEFGIDILDKLCDNYCLYVVSRNRLGRGEVVNLLVEEEKKEVEKRDFFRNFLNK